MAGDGNATPRPMALPMPVSVPPGLAPPLGHYSPAVVAGGLVFVSGLLPTRPDGTRLTDAPFAEQAQQVLEQLRAMLEAAGSSVAQLAQVRIYITELQRWPEFNQLYAAWAGSAKPARAVIPVPVLHHGVMLEIEAVALAGTPVAATTTATTGTEGTEGTEGTLA
jgi:2-iminobutanoate/2-iminopropanoate deaminase